MLIPGTVVLLVVAEVDSKMVLVVAAVDTVVAVADTVVVVVPLAVLAELDDLVCLRPIVDQKVHYRNQSGNRSDRLCT